MEDEKKKGSWETALQPVSLWNASKRLSGWKHPSLCGSLSRSNLQEALVAIGLGIIESELGH